MKISCPYSGIEAIVEVQDAGQHIQNFWAHGVFYEGQANGLLDDAYKRFQGQDVGIVYDIGAQRGNHSIWFAMALKAPVLAMEPNLPSFMALDRNMRLNLAGERVTRLMAAAGASEGFCSMEEGSGEGMTHVVPGAEVQVVPLDKFLMEDWVGLIKIDVEGQEMEVLKGLALTISQHRPFFYVEGELTALMDFFGPLGYERVWSGNATPTHGFSPNPAAK
ncbi:MAG: FkbM family methyltransferase [Rhodothermales bacterium]|jgi:FkbM family methyltransferase